jgi:hypothetical protein
LLVVVTEMDKVKAADTKATRRDVDRDQHLPEAQQ